MVQQDLQFVEVQRVQIQFSQLLHLLEEQCLLVMEVQVAVEEQVGHLIDLMFTQEDQEILHLYLHHKVITVVVEDTLLEVLHLVEAVEQML